MKKIVLLFVLVVLLVNVPSVVAQTGTVVFSSIPDPAPPNVPSLGYQCCSVSEFGDAVALEADTPRTAGFATVLMSSWAKHSEYPTMPSAGYSHPITLSIYVDEASARAHLPVKSVTQTFTIPWRPEHDVTCGGDAWKAADGNCYSGFAFKIVFDLRGLNYNFPNQFIYGVAFNTNTWGYSPIGHAGPFESLNVGTSNVAGLGVPPSVGSDLNPDVAYVNYSYGPFYSDGGSSGIGVFRSDTGWAGFEPAVEFSTFAVPTTADSCKNGAWQNLVRRDFTSFKNQGACVSYVTTGK